MLSVAGAGDASPVEASLASASASASSRDAERSGFNASRIASKDLSTALTAFDVAFFPNSAFMNPVSGDESTPASSATVCIAVAAFTIVVFASTCENENARSNP
eukprot:31194-Pelagococcus_subviridis.AAC.31